MKSNNKSEYALKLEQASTNYIEAISELPYQLKRIGWTQQSLAFNSGCTPTTITNWLKNPESIPPNKLASIIQFFANFDTAKR
jgi:transcriptional regulator with XRE-family HTH domain